MVVPRPIEQIVSGKDGVYELIYLQRESRMLSKYKKLVEGFDKYLGDDFEETEKKVILAFPKFLLILIFYTNYF